jgi:hypothetical protein
VSHRLLRDGGHGLVPGEDDRGDRQDGPEAEMLHRPAAVAGQQQQQHLRRSR